MPNGNMTTKEYVIKIDQKLSDFIESYKENKEDHNQEHKLMWRFIIGIPTFLIGVFTLLKFFGV
jgi:hypothetical protein